MQRLWQLTQSYTFFDNRLEQFNLLHMDAVSMIMSWEFQNADCYIVDVYTYQNSFPEGVINCLLPFCFKSFES